MQAFEQKDANIIEIITIASLIIACESFAYRLWPLNLSLLPFKR